MGRERPAGGVRVGGRPGGRPSTPMEPAAMRNVTTNISPTVGLGDARSRRSFLVRALGASALAAPALSLISATQASAGPKNNKKATGLTAELLGEIMNDEAAHVKVLQNLLDDEDNPLPVPIRPAPNLDKDALT